MKRFVGVDLHKNSFTVCYMQESGEYGLKSFKVDPRGIEEFKGTLAKEDEVALESTGNAGYFTRQIEGSAARIRIINPIQFKVISESIKKTDEHDAITISRYLSKGLIPEVRMRSKEEAKLASLIGTRDKFVKLRTTLKNKIHNILNANGIVTAKEMFNADKSLDRVLEMELDDADLFELRVIIGEIKNLNRSIDEIDKELVDRGKKLSGHKNLTSIKGSGKAIIATSRKLLTIVYRTLKNNWVFEDFSSFKLAVSI